MSKISKAALWHAHLRSLLALKAWAVIGACTGSMVCTMADMVKRGRGTAGLAVYC